MDEKTLAVVAGLVLAYALISRRLADSVLTPPLAFVIAGMVGGGGGGLGLGVLNLAPDHAAVHALAEITLILVLFADATRIDLRVLRREAGLPLRLLGLGLPMTVALGTGVALLVFPDLSIWEAALLGAVLAPTDAALGQVVVNSERVPVKIRQALNVESGLNDGIALPIVLIFAGLAGMGEEGRSAGEWALFTGGQLVLGPIAGIAVGYLGGKVATAARGHEWMGEAFEQLGALAMALLSYALAEAIGGNGFIAAFVAGMFLGNTAREFTRSVHKFLEAEGALLMLLVFLLLGNVFAWPALGELTPAIAIYALLSLTVVRMLPTSLSLVGAGLRPATHVFLGWFGPRGLATFLYGLLIVERSSAPNVSMIFTVAVTAVLFSVVAHGVTAAPGASLYARVLRRAGDEATTSERESVVEHPTRRALFRR